MKVDTKDIIYNSKKFAENVVSEISKININHFQDIVFNSFEYRNGATLKQHLAQIKQNENPLIYVIQLHSGRVLKLLLERFENYQAQNKGKIKNVDRVNLARYNKTSSDILYVGSSTTNFKTRIKNHLGILGSRVYSLHLSKWDNSLDYNLKISTYEVISTTNEKVERFIVEILEQQIWDMLKPIFGKRSGL